MSWWITVAAAGVVGIATWLYRRLPESEQREPEREYEACIRDGSKIEERRLHEEWREHQPGDWR